MEQVNSALGYFLFFAKITSAFAIYIIIHVSKSTWLQKSGTKDRSMIGPSRSAKEISVNIRILDIDIRLWLWIIVRVRTWDIRPSCSSVRTRIRSWRKIRFLGKRIRSWTCCSSPRIMATFI